MEEIKRKVGRPKKIDKRHLGNNRKYFTDEEKKQAQNRSALKYQKSNTTTFTFRFFNNKDEQIIEYIKSLENKTDYIRQLILEDIKRQA